jgi:outer membrane protein TolC
MAQAETAYWRLAIARTIAGKQQQSLQRAVKIQTWVAKRTSLRLAESADLLQAEAAVQSKKLDLQNAVNEQQLAALNFNTLRGSCEINVSERLCSYHEDLVFTLPLPCRPGLREDVKIAEQEEKIKIANAQLGIEKNKPILDLYASYALNGKNPSSNLAIAESFTADYPSTAVGLRLSMPLNFSRLAKDRAAYRKEMCGAKYEYQQKVYDNFREWELLTAKIQNLSNRLNITAKLASIEFGKLQAEQDRLKYGKTTTYQVLVFEQEYANSQIASLLLQAEILELRAQLKTFGV